MTILVLTGRMDPHADEVIRLLQENGRKVFRFDPARLHMDSGVAIEIDEQSMTTTLTTSTRQISMDVITKGWYRRPRLEGRFSPEATLDRYVYEQDAVVLRTLGYLLDEERWLCAPSLLDLAELKPFQLQAAAACGLETPLTLITDIPERVSEFVERRSQSGWATKPLVFEGVTVDSNLRLPFTAAWNGEVDGIARDALSVAPTVYQPYIPKRIEVRAVVVGDQVFAASADSQSLGETQHDIRVSETLKYEKYDLPDLISVACLKLVHHFRLNFSSIDLIVEPEGRHVFIDLNPNGQWLWLDRQLDLGIAEAISEWLAT